MGSSFTACNTTVTVRVKDTVLNSEFTTYLFLIFIVALVLLIIMVGIAFEVDFRLAEIERKVCAAQKQSTCAAQKHRSYVPPVRVNVQSIKDNIV